MSGIKIGVLIQARRRELGLSQEDLSEGICAAATLSRIENGERIPTQNVYDALMERLGYSSGTIDSYTDNNMLRVSELKCQIQFAYVNREYDRAREDLEKLIPLVKDHKSMDWQFVLYHQVLLQKKIAPEERLKKLEEALLLSCKTYKTKGLPRVMSHREINILNSMANTYGMMERRDEAIGIYRHILKYYDSHVVVPEESLRTQPMVLYNLSKTLGQAGRYDECIEVCDQGIYLARRTGRCTNLDRTLYNRGWALLRRGRETDREQAELSLRQAWYQATAMERQQDAVAIRKYYEQEFGAGRL